MKYDQKGGGSYKANGVTITGRINVHILTIYPMKTWLLHCIHHMEIYIYYC